MIGSVAPVAPQMHVLSRKADLSFERQNEIPNDTLSPRRAEVRTGPAESESPYADILSQFSKTSPDNIKEFERDIYWAERTVNFQKWVMSTQEDMVKTFPEKITYLETQLREETNPERAFEIGKDLAAYQSTLESATKRLAAQKAHWPDFLAEMTANIELWKSQLSELRSA